MFTEGKHSDKINRAHCPMIIQKRAPVVLQLVEKFENTIRYPNNGVRHISIYRRPSYQIILSSEKRLKFVEASVMA